MLMDYYVESDVSNISLSDSIIKEMVIKKGGLNIFLWDSNLVEFIN